ncbi:MAG: AAA family ATPase [Verrucomicrobiae bacterium]|nr:AAA family ATPase [Verrucomicrobiae bacterium]
MPVFKILPVLWRTVEEQEEKLKHLTDDQEHLLTMLQHQRKAAIDGTAGSGKTMLAMAQAQRFAREPETLKTLLLCYNRPLADWLSDQLPEPFRDKITATTYHSLVADWCKKAGIPFKPHKGDQDFWEYEAPEMLENAAAIVPSEEKFQAVVVDEGQDFRALWWDSLEKVFRETTADTPFYVFYDPKQNLFVEHPSLPAALGRPFTLPVNCRNTQAIARHCGEIIHTEITVKASSPEGHPPKHLTARDLKAAIAATTKQVMEWCMPKQGGMKPNQVAVLTGVESDHGWPDQFDKIPATHDFDKWRAGEAVLITTWRRFKGLEADALVLIDNPKSKASEADRYVASSRAKHLLTVVNIEP